MPSEGELFKKILGAEWLALHLDIRRRFDQNPSPERPLRYQGELSRFNIRIEIRHPILGLSFLQMGAFQAVPAQSKVHGPMHGDPLG